MTELSEEEKKAIDFTKYLVNDYKRQLELLKKNGCKNYGYEQEEVDVIEYRNRQFETLLNLIEKQENRIKELEEINKEHQKLNGELQDKLTYYENICKGKSIQEMGASKLYLTYDKEG